MNILLLFCGNESPTIYFVTTYFRFSFDNLFRKIIFENVFTKHSDICIGRCVSYLNINFGEYTTVFEFEGCG